MPHIHRLPEGIRIMLALVFILVAANFLFNFWTAGVSSGLGPMVISESTRAKDFSLPAKYKIIPEEQKSTAAAEISSPFVAIGEAVKSLEKMMVFYSSADAGEVSGMKRGANLVAANLNGLWENTKYFINTIYGRYR